jgi:outer membrane protein assembly factor BamB
MTTRRFSWLLVTMMILSAQPMLRAGDWPMWGGTASRNMVSNEKGLPDKFSVDDNDPKIRTNVKWMATLGSQSYGNPTVAGGRVLVGTNNGSTLVPDRQGDAGIVACFDEPTGMLLWQLTSPKLTAGEVSDFEQVGNCSSPTIDGQRAYLVTNRCEVVCLDMKGLADGNDGPFKDESQYIAGPGNVAVDLLPADADILWVFDMRDELGVFPNMMTSSSVLVAGDRLYVTTSNGRDWTNVHIPAPHAPALVCLDKQSGKLLGEERSGISSRTLKCNWSSPAYGVVNGRGIVIFGGDDGFCYGFDPVPVDGVLKELWRCDCNPPEYRAETKRANKGASGILSTPVFHEGHVYVSLGQDPDAGDGVGALVCIDASSGATVWMNKQIGRSISTVAVAEGLVYAAELGGKVYCLDARSGEQVWKHDAEGNIWGSPMVADGKVYIGTEDSTLWVLAAGREKKVVGDVRVDSSVLSTPVAANGVLYVMTSRTLYAAKVQP